MPPLPFWNPNITIDITDPNTMAASLTLNPRVPRTVTTELLRSAGVPFISEFLFDLVQRALCGPS